MNIMNKLTLRHMKMNKGRTIVTTIGIAASVALITAIFVSLASFFDMEGQLCLYSDGNCQARVSQISREQQQQLQKDERVTMAGAYMLPDENGFQVPGAQNLRNGGGNIMAADETGFRQLVTCPYEGTLPVNENEVALEEKIIEKNQLSLKPGDTMELSFGNRFLMKEGEKQPYYGNYKSEEQFEETNKRVVKVTAILHQNIPTQNTTMIRGMSQQEKSGLFDGAITLKKLDYNSLKEMKAILKKYRISEYDINTMFLETKFAFDKNSEMFKSMLPVVGIALAIVMVASILLIYNAFAMSLSERVRYLGMLASVGATKKQKRNSVYFEVLLQTLAGLVLGILVGILGIHITLQIIGGKIISTGMIEGIGEDTFSMNTVIPIWVIIVVILISVLTVFISAWIPARKASRISPMEAIRPTKDIRIRKKRLRTPAYIRYIFGYEGELAHKNLKRNSRKAKIITRSIGFSVILFLCVNFFCQSMIEANGMQDSQPHQITVCVAKKEKDKAKEAIEKIEDVKDVIGVTNVCVYYDVESGENGAKQLFAKENIFPDYADVFKNGIWVYINLLEDDAFRELCNQNSIDSKPYYDGKGKVILMNNVSHTKGGKKVFTENMRHQKFISEGEKGQEEFEVMDFASYNPNLLSCRLNPVGCVSAFMPESAYEQMYHMESSVLGVITDQHEKVSEEIEKVLEEGNFTQGSVQDYIAMYQTMNTVIFIMQVFIYGFIVLITLITIANIINTISTGIMLRRKEFAMLKSVGITPKGFRKMICLESFFYGERALIVSIPVSIVLCYFMNERLNAAIVPFSIPWKMYLAVIVVVFLIIGFSMYYSIYKLRGDSIIDTIKEEVL